MLEAWNPAYWLLALPPFLFGLFVQGLVLRSARRYLETPNAADVTGAVVAQRMIRIAGLGLKIQWTPDEFSSRYDLDARVLLLSRRAASSPSVASMAVVAHEIGHAQQAAQLYLPLRLHSVLIPAVSLSSWLGPILLFASLLLGERDLAWGGMLVFAGTILFVLMALPIELNASRRGLRLLEQSGLLKDRGERQAARQALRLVALTPATALAQPIAGLIYYALLLAGKKYPSDWDRS